MLRLFGWLWFSFALCGAALAQFVTNPGDYPGQRSSITADSTPTGGFVAGQIPYSDGAEIQATGLYWASNLLEQYNGTSAQALHVYNTFTNTANYERGTFDWTTAANVLTIGTQAGGSGTARPIEFVIGASSVFDIEKSHGSTLTTQLGYYSNATGGNQFISNSPTTYFGVFQAYDGACCGTNDLIGLSREISVGGTTTDIMTLNMNTGVVGITSNNGTPDTGLFRNAAGVIEANNFTAGAYREFKARSYVLGGTPPTNSGSCAITSQVGGNTAGTFVASGTCASGTYILTFAFTAPNGWACDAEDRTTTADLLKQTTSTTTSITFSTTTASADVIQFKCAAY